MAQYNEDQKNQQKSPQEQDSGKFSHEENQQKGTPGQKGSGAQRSDTGSGAGQAEQK